ncbi:MAG: hypothetical protein JNM62_11860 [Flavobacteriales bacterium]|nr:hypothetical protein [Flavobacteriales bacterium]
MYPRVLITATTFGLGTVALAQPHAFGCHYFRNLPGPLQYGAGVREQIDETIARSDSFDILHYDISLDLTAFQANAFKAVTEVSFAPRLPALDHIRFDLFALTVDSVSDGNGPLAFAHDGSYLDVQLGVAGAVGEERALTVYYHGTPHRDPDWGGFYYEGGYMYNLGIGLSTIPPNFGKVWYPCFDSFVERASYTYHVKSKGIYRLHGQGDFLGETQLAGDTVVRSFSLPQEIPTHISAVAVAAYVDSDYVHTGINGDIPVRLSAKAGDLSAMVDRFQQLGSAIDVCEHWYGPYPYDRVGYVLTTDGALEIATNIAYPEFMTGQAIPENRQLFTHELGHHWWGDHVTPHIHNDMWLKEGPAEYSGHLVDEWIYGREEFLKTVKDNHLLVLRTAHLDDDGFQPMSPMPDPVIYGTHTYKKGASVMHNLRGYMGDELFKQAMTGVQQTLGNGNMTSDGFKAALEQHSGLDLDPFFEAWVFAPGFAVFEVRDVEAAENGGTWNVEVEVGQKLRGATVLHGEVPMDITFIAADGTTDEQRITVGGPSNSVALQVPFQPMMTVLDRAHRLNQARMEYEIEVAPGGTIPNVLPWVDFRLYAGALVDTALVRIEHIWSGADQAPLAADVQSISDVHYWNVDGLWPEGTDFNARIYYDGEQATSMDYDLVGGVEPGMVVLYRATPQDTWVVHPDQTISMGNSTNGSGSIAINSLLKGQYAFGRSTEFIGIAEGAETPLQLTLGPVPAQDHLMVSGDLDGSAKLVWDILGADGRIIQRDIATAAGVFSRTIDVSRLASGAYVLRVSEAHGSLVVDRRFEVVR